MLADSGETRALDHLPPRPRPEGGGIEPQRLEPAEEEEAEVPTNEEKIQAGTRTSK